MKIKAVVTILILQTIISGSNHCFIDSQRSTQQNPLKNNFNPQPVMISEIFRHGARTPVYSNHLKPSSPHLQEIKDIGWGNLTGNGHHMHLLLGMQIRKDYPSLFEPTDANFHRFQSPKFKKLTKPMVNNFQYELYSSSVHRCIVSAQSHLLGIYPPGKETGDYLNHPDHDFVYKPVYDNLQVQFTNSTNSALPLGLRVFPVMTQSKKEDQFFFPGLTLTCNLPYDIKKLHQESSTRLTKKFLSGGIKRLEDAGFTAKLYVPRTDKASSVAWDMLTMSRFYDSIR